MTGKRRNWASTSCEAGDEQDVSQTEQVTGLITNECCTRALNRPRTSRTTSWLRCGRRPGNGEDA